MLRTTLKLGLLAYFCGITITDWWTRSWLMLFSRDEVLNLDAMVTFLRTLDYTTDAFGGHPFDPVLSSGLLTNFAPGLAFAAGGSLGEARLFSTGLQTLSVVALAATLFRRHGAAWLDALTVAAGVWVIALPLGGHDLRFINGGELWGFLWITVGMLALARSPLLAATFWGAAVWLGKVVYLPVGAALLGATIWQESSGTSKHGLGTRPLRYAAAFIAPLLAWMLLILGRHGPEVLLRWSASYLTFLVEHALGISIPGLPVFDGWYFSVAEAGADFLDLGPNITFPFLVPVGFGLVSAVAYLAGRVACSRSADGESAASQPSPEEPPGATTNDLPYVFAASTAVVLSSVWFVLLDPTQWGRHWTPTLYVAVGLTVYCAASAWSWAARSKFDRVAGVAAYAIVFICSWPGAYATYAYANQESWHGSYAASCYGPEPLGVSCERTGALGLVEHFADITCETERTVFHPDNDCMWRNRARFLELAVEEALSATPTFGPDSAAVMDGRPYDRRSPEDEASRRADAIYLLILIQHYTYFAQQSDFLVEFEPTVCPRPRKPLFDMMAAGGLRIDAIEAACAQGSDAPAMR